MVLENIGLAVEQVFTLHNIGLMSIGVFFGIIAGAIPGFTVTMAVVLSLPFTFGMPPVSGLSTMLGIYVGGLSGGLISGMLMGIPGTPASVATTGTPRAIASSWDCERPSIRDGSTLTVNNL